MGFQKSEKLLIKQKTLIKKNGKFILEIGFNQKNKVKKNIKRRRFLRKQSHKRLWK